MGDRETTGETRGRRAGEALGRRVGGLLGRRLGEWLAAGVGAARPGRNAETDAAADDHSASSEQRGSEEGSDEGEGDESGRPSSRADLDAMSYRDLQELAKEVDVTANLAREEMEDRLAATLDLDE